MKFDNFFKAKTDKLLSISFSQHTQKIVYVQFKQGNILLLAEAIKEIPFSEENSSQIIDFIREFLKINSIHSHDAYLSIADPDSIAIRQLVLPQLPKNEVLNAIQWHLKDELGFDCKNAISDWKLIKEYEVDDTKKQLVLFYCLRNTGKYLEILSKCDLLPLGITSPPFNYSNILRNYKESAKIQAVLDIGAQGSTLCIYSQNNLAFIRRLAFSAEKIANSLTDTLLTTKGAIRLSYEQAKAIRDNFGIIQDETQVLEGDIPAIHVISLMRPLLELLARELKHSFDYYASNFKEDAPSVLYLVGGGANLKNLDLFLSKELNSKVVYLDLPEAVRFSMDSKESFIAHKNQLMNAVGAVLGGAESIAFLPPEVKIKRIEPVEKGFLRFVALTAGLFLLVSYSLTRLQLNFYNKKLNDNKYFLNNIADVRDGVEKVVPLEEAIAGISLSNVPAEGALKVISKIMPNHAMLENVLLDQNNNSLIIKGTIFGKKNIQDKAVADILNGLGASVFFKKVSLANSKDNGDSGAFQINAELVF